MRPNLASQQSLADRFANVLRRFQLEGGSVETLAQSVGETSRDLRRWAEGTKMPAHVLCALLGELPRHLANAMIKPTGLQLVEDDEGASANALSAASALSGLAADITGRHADGQYCHRDRAAIGEAAQRIAPIVKTLESDGECDER